MINPNVVLAVTPRGRTTGLQAWKYFMRGISASAPLLVVMPHRVKDEIREEVRTILNPSAAEFLVEMEPPALGAGDIFRAACYFGFARDPETMHVLHTPIDVDYGNPHDADVQQNLSSLIQALNHTERPPDLIIGD
jgi:hypothetical protein